MFYFINLKSLFFETPQEGRKDPKMMVLIGNWETFQTFEI
jgi:hypothetical protein